MDVASERQRVLRGDADNDMVKIENLTKVGPGLVERPGGGGTRGRVSRQGRGPVGGVAQGPARAEWVDPSPTPGVQVPEDRPHPGGGSAVPRRASWRVLWPPGRERRRQDQHLQDADG